MTKNRIKLVIFVTLIFFAKLQAIDIFAEAKAAYFYLENNKFRKIYSDNCMYGLEMNCQVWNRWYASASVNYFTKRSSSSKQSSSSAEKERTKITLVPVGFGLKYLYCFQPVTLYAGAGVVSSYLHMREHSPYIIHKASKWAWKGIVKTGIFIDLEDQSLLIYLPIILGWISISMKNILVKSLFIGWI